VTAEPVPDAFADALAFTLRWEGGLANHPNDPGGRTAFGITQATYDASRKGKPKRDVWGITRAEVGAIYRRDYWGAVNGDGIAATNPKLALCAFDAAVNHGVLRAATMFQRTVQTPPDGKIGPATLGAMRDRLRRMGEAQLLGALLDRRRGYYAAIMHANPKLRVFRNGWRARLNDLCDHVGLAPVWDDLPPAA
jgi:lysozyme family protein